jgi:hypothetical protein
MYFDIDEAGKTATSAMSRGVGPCVQEESVWLLRSFFRIQVRESFRYRGKPFIHNQTVFTMIALILSRLPRVKAY